MTETRRILVVGTERSGTTWIARTIASGQGAAYVHEPDNPDATPAAEHARRSLGLYPVLLPGDRCPTYEGDWDLAFAGGWPQNRVTVRAGKALRRCPGPVRRPVTSAARGLTRWLKTAPRVVVAKSVHCMFSIRWLLERYDPQVVLVRRNPLSTVSSLIELGTTAEHLQKLYRLYRDPLVRKWVIEPLGLPDPPSSLSLVESCAWWVGLEDAALVQAASADWTVALHDQLCRDPIERFKQLFDQLSLRWAPEAEAFIEGSDGPGHGFSTLRPAGTAPERWLGLRNVEAARRVLELFPAGTLMPAVLEREPAREPSRTSGSGPNIRLRAEHPDRARALAQDAVGSGDTRGTPPERPAGSG